MRRPPAHDHSSVPPSGTQVTDLGRNGEHGRRPEDADDQADDDHRRIEGGQFRLDCHAASYSYK